VPLLDTDGWAKILGGAEVTVRLVFLSALLGTVIGVLGGVASGARVRPLRWLVRIYVELFRGVSALILLFWAAFALPQIFGINLSTTQAAVLALGTNMGAYATELARGAIQAVGRGQTEAAIAINLSFYQRIRHVILPQAFITMLPPYGNLLIEVLKASALVSLLPGVNDITREAQVMRINRGRIGESSFDIFMAALIVYLVLAQVISFAVRAAELRLSKGMDVGRATRTTVK